MKTGIYNIFFRGTTLLSKFLFVIFLGKYSVDESNLGIFGMITTAIGLLIYVIGFDFYVFNTREILKAKISLIEKIRNQLFFHALAYLIVVPISFVFIFGFNFISIKFLWIFLVLLISEHLGQELYRLFTTLERSVIANVMSFLRSGLWVWYAFFDYFILGNPVNIEKYILLWAISSWLSFFILTFILLKPINLQSIKYIKPDWRWIGLGVKTSGVFFIGSLSFQIIQFSDRFMIDYFYDKKLVGIYTAYAQFTNAIDVFTFSAVTMIAFPKLIKAYSDPEKYKSIKSQFSKHLILLSIVLILIVIITGPFIFKILEKDSFLNEINSFYVLLGGTFLLIVSNIYHYDLYVKRKDSIITITALIAVLVNVFLNIVLIPKYGIFGASLATFITFFFIVALKFYYSKNTQ
ncbi:hypothetical protein [Mariniflexile sp.]|uniref:hypothetical protein n=1 Tax=Mariniflexile sp. TaxID=1979402 RepID=UPI0040482EE4